MKHVCFWVLSVAHVLVWMFVLFAFLDTRAARWNALYVIPAIYIVHCMPFHALNSLKAYMYPDSWLEKTNSIVDSILVGKVKARLDGFFKASFASPVSVQGMMLFGMISCAHRLLI